MHDCKKIHINKIKKTRSIKKGSVLFIHKHKIYENSNFTYNPRGLGSVHIKGKLNVDGLIDPTGLVLTPQSTNPNQGRTYQNSTLWFNSVSNTLYIGGTSPFSESISVTNVGIGEGLIFRNMIDSVINLRSLKQDSHINITTNENEIVIATDATNTNTVNSIVSRDSSGDFSASIITANLIGSSSNNVLKIGDTMTGNLTMETQSQLRLGDLNNGRYVGLSAPSDIISSYNLYFPTASPTINQFLGTTSTDITSLEWITVASNVDPSVSRMIYVSVFGNNTTGNGSFNQPYLTLAKAIDVANGLSSSVNPISINISAGTYVENNSTGALSIIVSGITIIGNSSSSVIITPTTSTNNLLSINSNMTINGIRFLSNVSNSAKCLVINGLVSILNTTITGFNIGVSCESGNTLIGTCTISSNMIGISVNNVNLTINNTSIAGKTGSVGIFATGSGANIISTAGVYTLHDTAISLINNCFVVIYTTTLESNLIGCHANTGTIVNIVINFCQ